MKKSCSAVVRVRLGEAAGKKQGSWPGARRVAVGQAAYLNYEVIKLGTICSPQRGGSSADGLCVGSCRTSVSAVS